MAPSRELVTVVSSSVRWSTTKADCATALAEPAARAGCCSTAGACHDTVTVVVAGSAGALPGAQV